MIRKLSPSLLIHKDVSISVPTALPSPDPHWLQGSIRPYLCIRFPKKKMKELIVQRPGIEGESLYFYIRKAESCLLLLSYALLTRFLQDSVIQNATAQMFIFASLKEEEARKSLSHWFVDSFVMYEG